MLNLFLFFILYLLCIAENIDQTDDYESEELHYVVDTYPPYPVKPKIINYFLVNNVYSKNIDAAFKSLKSKTCLIFEKKKNWNDKINIHFFLDYSSDIVTLARNKKEETKAFLTNKTLHNLRLTSHYVGRTLGLTPEILRKDRDQFVKMNWNNLDNNYKLYYKNANITKIRQPNTNFNFGSLMFLSPTYGSKNNKPVFKAKISSYYNEMFAKFDYFSHNDKKFLNDIYCSNKCKKKISKCENGGYPHPSCTKCICPRGFEGKKCTKLASSKGKCGGKKSFSASQQKQFIDGDKFSGTCYFSIKSKPGMRVQVTVENLNLSSKNKCDGEFGLEIKHRDDKGADGLYLCGKYKKVEIRAMSNFVVIRYKVTSSDNKMKISYKEVKA